MVRLQPKPTTLCVQRESLTNVESHKNKDVKNQKQVLKINLWRWQLSSVSATDMLCSSLTDIQALLSAQATGYRECKQALLVHARMVQVVYSGGQILTMAGDQPEYVECLVTEGDTILYTGRCTHCQLGAGPRDGAAPLLRPGYETRDLKGGCLMPGFIGASPCLDLTHLHRPAHPPLHGRRHPRHALHHPV